MSNLTYRLATDDDIAGLCRLWEHGTDWGSLSEQEWRRWYRDTPTGPAIVAIAVAEANEPVAQLVMSVIPVSLKGRASRSLRLSSPIVHPAYRSVTVNQGHLLIQLAMTAQAAAAKGGFDFVYAIPHPDWKGFFRRYPGFATINYPCVSRDLASSPESDGVQVRRIATFGEDFEVLWKAARESLGGRCLVERRPTWLAYKYGGHSCLEIRTSGGALMGYAAVRPSDGLLADFLTAAADQRPAALSAVVRYLAESTDPERPFQQVKAMRTPDLAVALDTAGFVPVDFEFLVAIRQGAAQDIGPSDWYITPGD